LNIPKKIKAGKIYSNSFQIVNKKKGINKKVFIQVHHYSIAKQANNIISNTTIAGEV